jgi:hypothetical protein
VRERRHLCHHSHDASGAGRRKENVVAEIVVIEANDTLTHVALRGRLGVVATGISREILERLKVDTIFPVVSTYEEALERLMIE